MIWRTKVRKSQKASEILGAKFNTKHNAIMPFGAYKVASKYL